LRRFFCCGEGPFKGWGGDCLFAGGGHLKHQCEERRGGDNVFFLGGFLCLSFFVCFVWFFFVDFSSFFLGGGGFFKAAWGGGRVGCFLGGGVGGGGWTGLVWVIAVGREQKKKRKSGWGKGGILGGGFWCEGGVFEFLGLVLVFWRAILGFFGAVVVSRRFFGVFLGWACVFILG